MSMWLFTGKSRPAIAEPTVAGQESVWDYPRPPRMELDPREVKVSWNGIEVLHTRRAWRVLETASPPTFYLPFADLLRPGWLQRSESSSYCEWKGRAVYWDLCDDQGRRLAKAGWSYPEPTSGFTELKDCLSFFPALLHCTVGGETVRRQEGGFYGGWVTSEIVGPWKGPPGTSGW